MIFIFAFHFERMGMDAIQLVPGMSFLERENLLFFVKEGNG